MSVIKPFKGVRFSNFEISKVICPPYDVISKDDKKKLKKQSKNNMVYLELPDTVSKRNKYQESGYLYKEWLESDVLKKDEKESYYIYEQKFSAYGKKKARRGIFVALKVERPGKGSVKPHEKTLSKPKADRLSLLRSVRANLSPIFGIFNDNKKFVVNLTKKTSLRNCDHKAKDKDGIEHKLWVLNDKEPVNKLSRYFKDKKIFIADGHHRYETSWNYLSSLKGKIPKEANYILMFICPIEDPGLVVFPTHRVVKPRGNDIERRISENFNILNKGAFEKLSNKMPQPIQVYYKGKYRTLVLKNKAVLNKVMPGKPKAFQELGVSILHSVVLSDYSPENITYVKDSSKTTKIADSKNGYAFIVHSTPVESVKKIALAGEVMPQKSTYFYPKVVSGMVIHEVKQ